MQSATVVLLSVHLCELDIFRIKYKNAGHEQWKY